MVNFLLYFLLMTHVARAGGRRPEIREMPNAVKIKIVSVDHSGRIAIELNNESNSPLRIWDDSNSWGAARWRVLVLGKGQLTGFFQNPNRAFTRNGPGFVEIAIAAHVNKSMDLDDGDWCTLDVCPSRDQRGSSVRRVNLETGDVVIAIYDVPVTGEARKMKVWYGVAAATTTVQ